jgi:hypothetical protein
MHELKTPLTNISLRAELTLLEAAGMRAGPVSLQRWLTKVEKRMRFIVRQTTLAARRFERFVLEDPDV